MSFVVGNRVYFGRSVMEFVGTVVEVGEGYVVVNGVETGCDLEFTSDQRIKALQFLQVISEEKFQEYAKREPAFGGTPQRFNF